MKARWSIAALLLLSASPTSADLFPSQNVTLMSHLPLEAFASNPSSAKDCRGYVSPSGREYALIGLRESVGVVEITNRTMPVIVHEVPHENSNWCDIKVYGHHA